MNELEKKAFAYAADRLEDPNCPVYNWETEISYAYEQGYEDAITKAIEWLDEHLLDYWGQQNSDPSEFFIEFKKAMEGNNDKRRI